ncbi:MAG TPA: hypothetical protein VMP68_32970 [Candidatus Eisenbacteria bacterium]|nr:hypothetical protein [Candidatus Eisenbacteria bacterium]
MRATQTSYSFLVTLLLASATASHAQNSGSQTLQIDIVKVPNGQQVQWQRGADGELHPTVIPGSLSTGISRTQQELTSVQNMLNETVSEQQALSYKTAMDLAAAIPGGREIAKEFAASGQFPTIQNMTDLLNRISALKNATLVGDNDSQQLATLVQALLNVGNAAGVETQALTGYEAGTALNDRDYWLAVSHVLDAMVGAFGAKLSPELAVGDLLINLGADYYEYHSIANRQQQLLNLRDTLFQTILQLQQKDPATLAQWNALLNQLRGDPATSHAAFQRWLAANGVQQSAVLSKVFKDAPAHPDVIDPQQSIQDLEGIPGINPDFIAALQRCAQADAQYAAVPSFDNYLNQMACDKYPDGSYVSAFGPARGIGYTNLAPVPLPNAKPEPMQSDQVPAECAGIKAQLNAWGDSPDLKGCETVGQWCVDWRTDTYNKVRQGLLKNLQDCLAANAGNH